MRVSNVYCFHSIDVVSGISSIPSKHLQSHEPFQGNVIWNCALRGFIFLATSLQVPVQTNMNTCSGWAISQQQPCTHEATQVVNGELYCNLHSPSSCLCSEDNCHNIAVRQSDDAGMPRFCGVHDPANPECNAITEEGKECGQPATHGNFCGIHDPWVPKCTAMTNKGRRCKNPATRFENERGVPQRCGNHSM